MYRLADDTGYRLVSWLVGWLVGLSVGCTHDYGLQGQREQEASTDQCRLVGCTHGYDLQQDGLQQSAAVYNGLMVPLRSQKY